MIYEQNTQLNSKMNNKIKKVFLIIKLKNKIKKKAQNNLGFKNSDMIKKEAIPASHNHLVQHIAEHKFRYPLHVAALALQG